MSGAAPREPPPLPASASPLSSSDRPPTPWLGYALCPQVPPALSQGGSAPTRRQPVGAPHAAPHAPPPRCLTPSPHAGIATLDSQTALHTGSGTVAGSLSIRYRRETPGVSPRPLAASTDPSPGPPCCQQPPRTAVALTPSCRAAARTPLLRRMRRPWAGASSPDAESLPWRVRHHQP